jgi:hypothetical protein
VLGLGDGLAEPLERPLADDLGQGLAFGGPEAEPSGAALHGVDRRLQRKLEQRLAVEVGRERLPDPADRLAHAHALLGELVEAMRELGRHVVELLAERLRTHRDRRS